MYSYKLTFQPQVSLYQSLQYGSPYQSQHYSTNPSSTPLSITYPSNDYQSSVHHNVYSLHPTIPQLEYALAVNLQPQQSEFPQLDSSLSVPVFKQSDDPIDAINHMMSFLSVVITSCYPTTNNQLRNLSNPRTTKVKVLKELPKFGMVNTSLKKLKHHLVGFNVVVKERTMTTAITEGSWGFEDTKSCFRDKIIPFVKALKDIFNTFDQFLIDELLKSEKSSSNGTDIVNIVVNSSVYSAFVNMHECRKCLKLETELLNKKDFIEKETHDKLFRSYTTLEKHCISLEVDTQFNQEFFQRENYVSNQGASSFDQYFELNKLKAQSQEKDTIIRKFKERNKSLSGNMNKDKEKDLVITALKDELRKLKGKDLAKNVVTPHTIALEMLKIDVEPIAPRLENLEINWPRSITKTGYTWRPTGQTFTIVGNTCPLTRITTTTEVPPKKPTILENDTLKPVVTLVYSRKPRKSETNVPVSKPKIIKSIFSNNKEPSKSWGSIVFDVPSSSLDECRENHNLDVAHLITILLCIPIKINSEASSSSDVIPTIVHTSAPNSKYVTKWTNDHPLDNIIVEPKTYKDALTQACWIEAMQEELNEFEHLEVWELVPRPDKEFTKRTVDPTLSSKTRQDILCESFNMDNMEFSAQNILHKALCRERIEFLISKLGMRSFTLETLKQLADEAEE
ncbi:hypothetical protein Tco_0286182 [Tanacetum coccineum]